MKLITKTDLISIGISPDKIIEFNASPIMLINNKVFTATAMKFNKLEDVLKLDWINDINKGDAGLIILYGNSSFETFLETKQGEFDKFGIEGVDQNFILRTFSKE